MKRIIVINNSRSALVITDHIHNGVELVASDSAINEEIYAFDTYIHMCYCVKKAVKGYEIIEEFVPLLKFRNFAKCIGTNPSKIYNSIIASFIK